MLEIKKLSNKDIKKNIIEKRLHLTKLSFLKQNLDQIIDNRAAFIDNVIIGYVVIFVNAEINWLACYISKNFRRMGIAKKLIHDLCPNGIDECHIDDYSSKQREEFWNAIRESYKTSEKNGVF